MTLALIAIIVTIVLCICSNGKAQAAKWGTRSDSKLQFELYEKYRNQVLKLLDSPATKGKLVVDSILEAYKIFRMPSPYLGADGNYEENARDKYDNAVRANKGNDDAAEKFFLGLYDVLKTYSWIKHFPDKPIEDSNKVELTEEEAKAAHEFFLSNLQDYMYKRYWLEEFERDGLEYHCVLIDPYRDYYNYSTIKKDITGTKCYIESGVYDDDVRVEIYRSEIKRARIDSPGYGIMDDSDYEKDCKNEAFLYNFVPIFPTIPMFNNCPILPPFPPNELLSKAKTALHRMDDQYAILRSHNHMYGHIYGHSGASTLAEKITTEDLKSKGICVASWNGKDTPIQEVEKRIKRDEMLKKKNPSYPYLDPIPPKPLPPPNPREDKLSIAKYYKHYEEEFERVSDEYRERLFNEYLDARSELRKKALNEKKHLIT